MADQSNLESKYFLDGEKYNCPFCKVRAVSYSITNHIRFGWSENREVHIYLVKCNNPTCTMVSAHFSDWYWNTTSFSRPFSYEPDNYDSEKDGEYDDTDLDKFFFHHQPTSFFTVDNRIPPLLRNLISEAEGCRNMNFMVGASGALRKAIYEFLKIEKAEGKEYEDKIKWMKSKYPKVESEYFEALLGVQGMTSKELHEQDGSFVPWSHEDFDYFMEVVKDTFSEVYVQPELKKGMRNRINLLMSKSSFSKNK